MELQDWSFVMFMGSLSSTFIALSIMGTDSAVGWRADLARVLIVVGALALGIGFGWFSTTW